MLDPAYNAYVTALSSRMHAHIDKRIASEHKSTIIVESPQFGGKWKYNIDLSMEVAEFSEAENKKHPFLEAAIKTVLNYVQPTENFSLNITLFSDPGYHTQESTTAKTSSNEARKFLYHSKPIEQVAKTGMGLSAGLVCVVTGALISHFTRRPLDEIRNVIHNVAQIAHCEGQGKIGSGFDVAAAVYGSIIYKRFTPETIDHVLSQPLTVKLCSEIQKIVDSEWEFNHTQCSLPKGIRLLMGDVNGGSETPKLVSKVLAWRKSDPNSAEVYAELDLANESLMSALRDLQILETRRPEAFDSETESKKGLEPVVNSLKRIRHGLQRLTASSGADIEPSEQTSLLDQCVKLPGCLGGVVPGAGGYDAICLLVEENKIAELKKSTSADPAFSNVTWLDLTEEAQGLQEENAVDYYGLI